MSHQTIQDLKSYYNHSYWARILFPKRLKECLDDTNASDLDILKAAEESERSFMFRRRWSGLITFYGSKYYKTWSFFTFEFQDSIYQEFLASVQNNPHFVKIMKMMITLNISNNLTNDVFDILKNIAENHPNELLHLNQLINMLTRCFLLTKTHAEINFKHVTRDPQAILSYLELLTVALQTGILGEDDSQKFFQIILNYCDPLDKISELTTTLKKIADSLRSDFVKRIQKTNQRNYFQADYNSFFTALLRTLLEQGHITTSAHEQAVATKRYSKLNNMFIALGRSGLLNHPTLLEKYLSRLCQCTDPKEHAAFLAECYRMDCNFSKETEQFYLDITSSHTSIRLVYFWLQRLRQSGFSLNKSICAIREIMHYPSLLIFPWGKFTRLSPIFEHELEIMIDLAKKYHDNEEMATHEIIAYANDLNAKKRIFYNIKHTHDELNNTLINSIATTCSSSAIALYHRYQDQINTKRKLNNVLQHILMVLLGMEDDVNNGVLAIIAHNIINTLIIEDIPYKHPESNLTIYQLLAIIWRAIHDKERCRVSNNDAYIRVFTCISEIVAEKSTEDKMTFICPLGIFHKMIEALYGMHDDVIIRVLTYGTCAWRLKSLVLEETWDYLSKRLDDDMRQSLYLLNFEQQNLLDHIWPYIKDSIEKTLYDEFSLLFPEGIRGDAFSRLLLTRLDVDISSVYEQWIQSDTRKITPLTLSPTSSDGSPRFFHRVKPASTFFSGWRRPQYIVPTDFVENRPST